jgi:hypothetical protein
MIKTKICIDCVKEFHLKELIENSHITDNCSFCNNKRKICDYQDDQFYYLLKSLIRYYYNEWDYNEHLGGESLYKLLITDHIFFNKDNFTNPNDIENLIELVENFEAYEKYNEGISLHAGYDEDGNQNFLLRALKSEIDNDILKIIKLLKHTNYFELEELIINGLREFIDIAKINIVKNSKYYRARIGYSKKEYDYLDGGMEGKYIYSPFSENEISSPPPFLTQSGRLNRAGVSFLYCATNSNTAISEVRPHPGDKVSVGCFMNKEELKIFNLSKDYLLDFYRTDALLDKFVYLNSLNLLFQKTIPPSKRESYSITQIVSDSIRKLGFDGILFDSSVGEGENLVIFEPTKMIYINDEKHIVLVKKVKYDFEELR